MSEIRNKIITISGEPVSGKSTVVKMLKQKYEEMGYNVHIILTGHIFREIIIGEYLKMYPDRTDANLADIQTDESFAKKRSEIDGLIDEQMAKKGQEINSVERPNDVYIIDSRLAWHNIPESYAVRLTVDETIAGKRVFEDKTRGNEDAYETLDEAIKKTRQRKNGEIVRYKERYGVDLSNPENYDLIVDTSYSNISELADIIIDGESSYRQGETYPKTWASPVHFLTVQKIKDCFEKHREILTENIKENGYSPIKGEVNIVEYNGAKFLLDGNHRIYAALAAGKTLIPYQVTHKDDRFTAERVQEVYDDFTLERIYDWADGISYYGGELGEIEQFKDFKVTDLFHVDKIPIARKWFKLDEPDREDR